MFRGHDTGPRRFLIVRNSRWPCRSDRSSGNQGGCFASLCLAGGLLLRHGRMIFCERGIWRVESSTWSSNSQDFGTRGHSEPPLSAIYRERYRFASISNVTLLPKGRDPNLRSGPGIPFNICLIPTPTAWRLWRRWSRATLHLLRHSISRPAR